MSESPRSRYETINRQPSRRIVAGLASIALLPAVVGIAPSGANANPTKPAKIELGPVNPSASSVETAGNTENARNFTKLMNARTKESAIRFGRTPNKGPIKPGTVYESYVGINRVLIRNFGTSPGPYSDKGFSITTVAPERKNGSTVFSKLVSTEMRAGNQRLSFAQDYTSGDWIVDWQVSKRNGETQRVVAAADLDIALMNAYDDDRAVKLTPARLAAANQVATDIQQDILAGGPVERYHNPLK